MLDVGQLFEQHHGVVYRRCLALLGQPDDAAEAVQDVFEQALAGLGRFRLQSSPLTWLYAIATRRCLQQVRNRSSRRLALVLLCAPEAAPEPTLDRAEVERALQALDRDEQELAVYAYRDGLTQEEISDVLRVSRKTVGKRLQLLHARLADVLREESSPELRAVGA
jgi:RNA polymerase sigma-70 factor (ECF subfamily)